MTLWHGARLLRGARGLQGQVRERPRVQVPFSTIQEAQSPQDACFALALGGRSKADSACARFLCFPGTGRYM
jgi:hypothetical protein